MTPQPLSRAVLLDSSPLLLLLAGRADPHIIARFKHLAMFEVDDYQLLVEVLSRYNMQMTTPHVLTEVSNHAHHLKGPLGTMLLQTYAAFAREAEEHFRPSMDLSLMPEFQRLGLTDCALVDLDESITVITEDFRLAAQRTSNGKPVINFNYLRQSRLI